MIPQMFPVIGTELVLVSFLKAATFVFGAILIYGGLRRAAIYLRSGSTKSASPVPD